MNKYEAQQRTESIPYQIRQIGLDNPLIRRIEEMFISGQIITKEEMLCQMIVQLASNWESQRKEYEKLILMTNLPVFTAPK